MGGIPIAMGMVFSLLIWLPLKDFSDHKYLFGALLIMFIIGLRDDLIPLKPIYKLFSQLVPSLMLVFLTKLEIHSFYGLMDGLEFPLIIKVGVTVATLVVITNSLNLIDGVDGLAGTISVIALSAFGTWFMLLEEYVLVTITFSLVGALLAFLWYNWEPSKIFMGDTGALLLGFFLAYLAIRFINLNDSLPDANTFKFQNSIATAFCILIIPLFDTLRVFIIRLLQKRSPFSPDNNHMHHLLIRLGLNHSKTVSVLALINLFYILLAISIKDIKESLALLLVLGMSLIISFIFYLTAKDTPQLPGNGRV